MIQKKHSFPFAAVEFPRDIVLTGIHSPVIPHYGPGCTHKIMATAFLLAALRVAGVLSQILAFTGRMPSGTYRPSESHRSFVQELRVVQPHKLFTGFIYLW